MAGGRPPTVTDEEILQVFVESDDPALFSKELTEAIGMTQQAVYNRLRDLVNQGMLESKMNGDTRMWWITDAGREFVESAG